jgi:hypothetical protein
MKRIAVLTFFNAKNYGGDLQAFALQKKLSLLRYEVKVIQLFRPQNKEFIRSNNFLPIINLTDKISKKAKLNSKITNFISKLAKIVFKKRFTTRQNRFLSFEKENINLSEEIFYNFDQLYNRDLPYDIFITGSDQVWNYTNGFSPEPYFLTFVKKGKKKISYAASIGHSNIPAEIEEKYRTWFNNIDYISTREEQAEQLIKDISGKDAITALDPTFLLTMEEWLKIFNVQKQNSDSYLLIYNLSKSPYLFKLAQFIAKRKNFKIIRIVPSCWTLEHHIGIKNIYDAGPVEFVKLFANASFVLTNSFHGTAFSINFNIPFFTVQRRNNKTNSRFINILNKTNLYQRLIYDDSPFPVENIFDLDFSQSNHLLDFERSKSLDFLINSIEIEK